jgi:hypothetical protein
MSEEKDAGTARANPFREIVQPFIDLVHAPRALWESRRLRPRRMVYFRMLGYLAMHWTSSSRAWSQRAQDEYARHGRRTDRRITISMFFLRTVADKEECGSRSSGRSS